MSQPDEPVPHAPPAESGATDPVVAMRAHIAHLESELAAAINQVNEMESEAGDRGRRAEEAIKKGEYEHAHAVLLGWHENWQARDDEVGILKADIRVLRVLLAECQEWLASRTAE